MAQSGFQIYGKQGQIKIPEIKDFNCIVLFKELSGIYREAAID
jgi:hypothetical protein